MLIGLHGKKQAGKDTVYARILHLLGPGTEADAVVERASFADLLYESAAASLGVTVDLLQSEKSNPLAFVELRVVGARAEWIAATSSLREYLQRYGTESHREVFGQNFWVDAVDLSHDRKIVVVTDVRFPNEAQAVIDAGGSVVRVVGPISVEKDGDGHASEVPLPGWMVDFGILNGVRNDDYRALDAAVLETVLAVGREAAV